MFMCAAWLVGYWFQSLLWWIRRLDTQRMLSTLMIRPFQSLLWWIRRLDEALQKLLSIM